MAIVLCPRSGYAETIEVDSPSDFSAAVTEARPGDEIVIADGVHSDWGLITVTADGTRQNPVVIRGARATGTTLRGAVNLRIRADWVVLRDLRFQGPSPRPPDNWTVELRGADDVRIENVVFDHCGNHDDGSRWLGNVLLRAGVHRLEIRDSVFDGYESAAFHVYVIPDVEPDFPTDISIRNCLFRDGNVEEAISLGAGNRGNDGSQETRVLVEGCRFEGHSSVGGNGTEMFHIKTSANTFRNNTFVDCDGHLSNRSGANNVYDGNLIIGQHIGVRVIDRGNSVINNLFIDTRRPIWMVNANGSNYRYVEDTLIAHNTFIRARGPAVERILSGRAPRRTRMVNNVFIGSGGDMLGDVGDDATISHNLFFATDGSEVRGDVGNNATMADPQLSSLDADGFFTAGSPVINRGMDVGVARDFVGASRDTAPDIGHREHGGMPSVSDAGIPPAADAGLPEADAAAPPAADAGSRETDAGDSSSPRRPRLDSGGSSGAGYSVREGTVSGTGCSSSNADESPLAWLLLVLGWLHWRSPRRARRTR